MLPSHSTRFLFSLLESPLDEFKVSFAVSTLDDFKEL